MIVLLTMPAAGPPITLLGGCLSQKDGSEGGEKSRFDPARQPLPREHKSHAVWLKMTETNYNFIFIVHPSAQLWAVDTNFVALLRHGCIWMRHAWRHGREVRPVPG